MDFVTRKVTAGIGKILRGESEHITVGNIDAVRDWGHAKDYVEAMWLILQAEKPDDFVIATGETHTVREFIELAFRVKGITIAWRGQGLLEEGFDENTNIVYVKISEQYFRPLEVSYLEGDSSKARAILKWYPKTSFLDLVYEMVNNDTK